MEKYRKIPTEVIIRGEEHLAMPFIDHSKKLVTNLVNSLKYGELKTARDRVRLSNGLVIYAWVNYNRTIVKFDTTDMDDSRANMEDDDVRSCIRVCKDDLNWDENNPSEIAVSEQAFTVNEIEWGGFLEVSVDGGFLNEDYTETTMEFTPCPLADDICDKRPCPEFTFSVYIKDECEKIEIFVADDCHSLSETVEIIIDPLEFDLDDSIDVIADNSNGSIIINGGRSPIIITLDGQGFWLNDDLTITTAEYEVNNNITAVSIFTSEACGSCNISISDGCSEAEGYVRSISGEWQMVEGSDCHQPTTPQSTTCLLSHPERYWHSRAEGKYNYVLNWWWNIYGVGGTFYTCPSYGMYVGARDSCGDTAGQYRKMENTTNRCHIYGSGCVRYNYDGAGGGTPENAAQGFNYSRIDEWIC